MEVFVWNAVCDTNFFTFQHQVSRSEKWVRKRIIISNSFETKSYLILHLGVKAQTI